MLHPAFAETLQSGPSMLLACVRLFSYLTGVSNSRSWLIPQPLHRCYRGFTEVWRLSIHHLNHHDAHRPYIDLEINHDTGKKCLTGLILLHRLPLLAISATLVVFMQTECVPPHFSAIWRLGYDLRRHPIRCPH